MNKVNEIIYSEEQRLIGKTFQVSKSPENSKNYPLSDKYGLKYKILGFKQSHNDERYIEIELVSSFEELIEYLFFVTSISIEPLKDSIEKILQNIEEENSKLEFSSEVLQERVAYHKKDIEKLQHLLNKYENTLKKRDTEFLKEIYEQYFLNRVDMYSLSYFKDFEIEFI